MSRTARCCCGALRAEVCGDPDLVAACHCEQCQRRTGAPFGVSAYYRAEQVRTAGASKVFSRSSQAGRNVETHFCPECGTSVYWRADFMPGQIGIAAGAFFDPDFPAPTVSAWEQSRHPWIKVGCDVLHLPQQEPA
jgi:hypothetical protein